MHTRQKPLADDVDLSLLAAAADGCMGADLAGICSEAAMAAVRRVIIRADGGGPPDVSRLKFTQSDLYAALARNAGRHEDADGEFSASGQ